MSNSKYLIINAGSSSIKFQVFDESQKILAKGLCERIFVDGHFEIVVDDKKITKTEDFSDHEKAFKCILDYLLDLKVINDLKEIIGIGHRVVQGADYFKDSVIVDDTALAKIDEYIKLAPLHNKPESEVIKIVQKIISHAVNVAVFDTTFHVTRPAENYMYAVPKEWQEKFMIKKYGAHGTSYRYINLKMQKVLNKKEVNLIICHLGNGASICSVKNSKSYNTSMGFTPLEGLIMGTRSGDIDPAVVEYLCNQSNMTVSNVINDLNKKSGILGLTGSADMRDVLKNREQNKVAIKMYCQRVADYIIKYWNQLSGEIDAIVFTAGVGENSNDIVKGIIESLPVLKIELSDESIQAKYDDFKLITTPNSHVNVYQVRTNEELMILQDILRLLKK